SLWEVAANGKGLHPLLPGWDNSAQACCGSWSPDGKYFFFQTGLFTKDKDIWVLREAGSSFIAHLYDSKPEQLTTGPIGFGLPVSSSDGKKLFVRGTQPRAELVRYDSRTKRFVPYLSGISVGDVDISRDGKWVTYVTLPENTLWRSKLDGTDRLQL